MILSSSPVPGPVARTTGLDLRPSSWSSFEAQSGPAIRSVVGRGPAHWTGPRPSGPDPGPSSSRQGGASHPQKGWNWVKLAQPVPCWESPGLPPPATSQPTGDGDDVVVVVVVVVGPPASPKLAVQLGATHTHGHTDTDTHTKSHQSHSFQDLPSVLLQLTVRLTCSEFTWTLRSLAP